jgi:hypothetical protein
MEKDNTLEIYLISYVQIHIEYSFADPSSVFSTHYGNYVKNYPINSFVYKVKHYEHNHIYVVNIFYDAAEKHWMRSIIVTKRNITLLYIYDSCSVYSFGNTFSALRHYC